MRASVTSTFSEPEEFQAAMSRAGSIGLIFMPGGRFRARSAEVKLNRLCLLSVEERRSRIAFIRIQPGTILIGLSLECSAPPVWSGMGVNSRELITLGADTGAYMRIEGTCHWGAIWLPVQVLARYGQALTGRAMTVPRGVCHWRPRVGAARSLRQLFLSAIRMTYARSVTAAGPEAAHGLEQQLIELLVECLATAPADAATPAMQRELKVMAGFEALLRDNPEGNLGVPTISAALHVPVRLLRTCCAEHLGVSPMRYIHFYQMQLAHHALRRGAPRTGSVADVAARFGFRDLRRFAESYQELYGEPPFATLHRGLRREAPDFELRNPDAIAEPGNFD